MHSAFLLWHAKALPSTSQFASHFPEVSTVLFDLQSTSSWFRNLLWDHAAFFFNSAIATQVASAFAQTCFYAIAHFVWLLKCNSRYWLLSRCYNFKTSLPAPADVYYWCFRIPLFFTSIKRSTSISIFRCGPTSLFRDLLLFDFVFRSLLRVQQLSISSFTL